LNNGQRHAFPAFPGGASEGYSIGLVAIIGGSKNTVTRNTAFKQVIGFW
jgi:hypothetical protein